MSEFIFSILVLLIGMGIGAELMDASWRGDMVERGYAHYDTKTADWKWNEERP